MVEAATKEVKEFAAYTGEPFNYELLGITFSVVQYIGVGTLNVNTGRGEVKAQPGDFILRHGDVCLVLPAPFFERLAKASGRDDIITYEEFLAGKTANSKSGPDKFTLPVDPPSPPEASAQGEKSTSSDEPLSTSFTPSDAPYETSASRSKRR